jgi:hypothetical protein
MESALEYTQMHLAGRRRANCRGQETVCVVHNASPLPFYPLAGSAAAQLTADAD